jgi:protein involved in polysaccharide export with SLBB domain
MILRKTWGVAVAVALLATAALAQTPVPARSFGQLEALDLKLIAEQNKTARPGDLFFNPGQDALAQTQAQFTGQSRPIDARMQGFIISFASTGPGNQAYAKLYQREYLFRADGQDRWLPVQGQVATYFARELKAGDTVTLFLRNAGGFRNAAAWDWVFLVEEFQSPNTPKAPPGKRPVIPPGPKIET